MSLCLIAEGKNCMWIGGDTAVSTTVNGKTLRVADHGLEKVYQHANAVFMSLGSVRSSKLIRRHVESFSTITEDTLDLLGQRLKQIIIEGYPLGIDYNYAVLAVVLLDTGRAYVIRVYDLLGDGGAHGTIHGIRYDVESPYEQKLTGFRPICCRGLNDDDGTRGFQLADKYSAECSDIPEIYLSVFNNLSSNGVGGDLDLYCLNIKAQEITKCKTPIEEKNIEYYVAQSVHSANIIGSTISWSGTGDEANGTLDRSRGDDGVNASTPLIKLGSDKGILIRAEDGGMSLQASKGIWMGTATATNGLNVKCNDGKTYNLAEVLPKIIAALGIS